MQVYQTLYLELLRNTEVIKPSKSVRHRRSRDGVVNAAGGIGAELTDHSPVAKVAFAGGVGSATTSTFSKRWTMSLPASRLRRQS